MKQAAKVLGGILLAAFLLWLVLRGVDLGKVRDDIASASIAGLVLATVFNVGHVVFRIFRWRLLLRPTQPAVPFRPMFSAVILGYLTTWVIPGRLGELVRPALLATREKIPLGPCIGSVVADRLLDGAAIVGLFAVGIFLAPLDAADPAFVSKIRLSAFVLVIVVAFALSLLLIAGAARTRLSAWIEARSSKSIRWCGRTFLALAAGTDALRSPRLLVPIVFHSLLVWLAIAYGTWLGVKAAGVDVPFTAMLVLLPPLALGVAIPTPAGAGGYHYAMKWGLTQLFGVDAAAAASAGILMHLVVTLPVLVLGMTLLKTERISWKDLTGIARNVGELGAAAPARKLEAAR